MSELQLSQPPATTIRRRPAPSQVSVIADPDRLSSGWTTAASRHWLVLSRPSASAGRTGEIVCYSPFGCWTNLRGGAPVTVTVRGQRIAGWAAVCTDPATIAPGMAEYLRHNPGDAFFFRVKLNQNREPVAQDVERAAHENVQIRIALADAPTRTGRSRRQAPKEIEGDARPMSRATR